MNQSILISAALLAAMIIVGQPLAAESHVNATTTRIKQTAIANIPLSKTDRARAFQWHLSLTEWQRYKFLMRGIRGSLSPNISPIEALGIAARTTAERTHYARVWARMMARDTAQVLAFQRAYDAAWRTLYPDMQAISTHLSSQLDALKTGDRLLFFTRRDCPACDRKLVRLLTTVKSHRGVGLDIYVAGTLDDNGIRAWAQRHAISVTAVKHGSITLNHDGGTLKRLTGSAKYPTVLRRGNQAIAPFNGGGE